MELLVVVALIGLLAAIVSPVAAKWIRRSGDVAAYSTVHQVLALARLEAVKRSANVIVEISLSPDNRIRLHSFEDRANDPIPTCAGGSNVGNPCTQDSECPGSTCKTNLPADEATAAGNCVQDTGTFATSPATDEPTLGDVTLSPRIHFWKLGGNIDDVDDAVRFDKYVDTPGSGNSSCDSSKHRIIFLPTGGISIPQASNSGPNPSSPTADERGIYFAEEHGKNYFRVTVESDLSGKARVEKYVDEASPPGYYAPNSDPMKRWRWL